MALIRIRFKYETKCGQTAYAGHQLNEHGLPLAISAQPDELGRAQTIVLCVALDSRMHLVILLDSAVEIK